MSNYRVVETVLTDEQYLVEALKAMGYTPEVHKQPVTLTDYHNNSMPAHIVIPNSQLIGLDGRRAWASIGFFKKEGTYNLVVDEYDRTGVNRAAKYDETWLGRLSQQYQLAKTLSIAALKGYRLLKRSDTDGKISLQFAVR